MGYRKRENFNEIKDLGGFRGIWGDFGDFGNPGGGRVWIYSSSSSLLAAIMRANQAPAKKRER